MVTIMMLTHDISLEHYQPDTEKLLAYGFRPHARGYTYTQSLTVPSFTLQLDITPGKSLKTEVIDGDMNEVYRLHLNPAVQGEFVGRIRQEYHEIVTEILATCFSKSVFIAAQSIRVIRRIKQHYGIDLEYLWAKFPRNAVARRKDNKKWFAAILTVRKDKLGLEGEEIVEVLNLKMRPEDKDLLIDNVHYFPGYHMNKKHWFTLCLDDRVSDESIFCHLAESYQLNQPSPRRASRK